MSYHDFDFGPLSHAEMLNIINNPPKKVYFIRCEQYVKIGASKWPPDRLKNIRWGVSGALTPQFSNSRTAELVATEPGGLKRERELHAKFAHLRHTGEWFAESPELTRYINSLTEPEPATLLTPKPRETRIEWFGRLQVHQPVKS